MSVDGDRGIRDRLRPRHIRFHENPDNAIDLIGKACTQTDMRNDERERERVSCLFAALDINLAG